jgi:hypothetical protein
VYPYLSENSNPELNGLTTIPIPNIRNHQPKSSLW